jgi:cysteine desulfurase/selenocysteine lyase
MSFMQHELDESPLDVAALRADFPILATTIHDGVPLAYLDNGASTQHPRAVIQAMVDSYEQSYANVHRGIHWLSERSTDLFELARVRVQRFLGAAAAEEIIFTRGTTESINLVARSWGDANLRAGDEVLLTEMEHHANIVPWQQAAERTGATLRWLPISDDGLLRLDLLDEYLTPRTKLVAVTAVSNVLGTINPIVEIIARARAVGALVLVDAAQSVPHLPTDVAALGADFLAFSGHKMLGPTGIGVLYGRRELLEAMPPFLGGGGMIRRVRQDGFDPAGLPSKFEAGTPPIVEAIGLGVAIEYLQRIGLERIHEHEQRLTRAAHAALAEIEGLKFVGPKPEHKAGIVSFTCDVHPHDVAQVLDQRGVAVRAGHHCAMPLHKRLGIVASTRASFYLYNTLEEVDRLASALVDAQRLLARKSGRR